MLPPDLAQAPDADITKPSGEHPLVFLPLWMDLGLHAVPAVSLIIGESCFGVGCSGVCRAAAGDLA